MNSKKKNFGSGKMSVRKKMEHGGLHTDPTEPTRADSLDLYNNALLVKDYYTGRGTYKWDLIENLDHAGGIHLRNFKRQREFLEKKYGDPDKILDAFPKNRALKELEEKYGSYEDTSIGEIIDASFRGRDMYEPIDQYRFKRRESFAVVIDDNAPMQLFDTRISPTQYLRGENIKEGDIMRGDKVEFYGYDPIAVAPADELTHDQLIERVKKYGNSGVPIGYQDPNKPGYGVQSSQSSPTPSRPRIEIDKMPPLDFSIDLPTTLQPIERPEGDRLIDTQDIYRTPLSNRNNVRGDEQSLDQVGERRVYERPDGTRYTSVDRFSPEMIRQLRRLQRERERGTVTF
jgi:hypothetical protein